MKRKPHKPDDKAGEIADFLPPEGVPIRFQLAGLGARTVAQLTDILITVAALVALMATLYFSNLLDSNGMLIFGALAFFFIRAPYYIFSEILMNGQTLGKRLSGLRVISADGRSLSPHSVTVRNLMKEMEIFVPGTMLLAASNLDWIASLILMAWVGILLAVPIFSKRRQRLGDILAGTYVVNQPQPVLLPDLAKGEVAAEYTFQPHQLDHYGRYELQTLESLLQVKTEGMNRTALDRHTDNLKRVADTIMRRITYTENVPEAEAEAFLRSFYRTQRAYLENRKLFGDSREDKFHRAQSPDGKE